MKGTSEGQLLLQVYPDTVLSIVELLYTVYLSQSASLPHTNSRFL